jgi:small-conductance mechanosensitive channel/CRP-like cAMP-binding protein
MRRAVEVLSDGSFLFGGIGIALAAILIVALLVLLPRGQRRLARLPMALLASHGLLLLVLWQLPRQLDLRRPLETVALFLLLSCLGRAGFVLAADWFFGFRLRSPLSRIFRDLFQVVVFFGIGFITLREAGAELGSLLTTSALLTAVVGLSLQETLGNFFAGLAIQAQRPFRVGHWIQVEGSPEGAVGHVMEINWRATKILTDDRVEVIVPNATLAKSPIRNFSEPSPVSRRMVEVSGPYDVAPHRMEAALLEAARGCPGVLEDPPPTTWVSLFADSGINYRLVYFIDDFPARPVIDSRVRRRIWYALQRAGISIPFPVRDVRVQHESPAATTADAERRTAHHEQVLRSVYFLESLPDSAFEALARGVQVRLFAAEETIIRQGEPGAELFVLQHGSAVVCVQQPGREAVEVARLGPGDVVGEMSLVTGAARSATVRASTPCECLVIGHEPFRRLLAQHPDLAQRISEVLAERQAELDSAHLAEPSEDRATQSHLLLDRIRSFFALWPGSVPPPSKKP